MELTPERLATQLAAEPLRPAYLIAGPEPLRVLEAADAVRAQARTQGFAEREVFEPEGRDVDWDALDATFRAPSLFSTRRDRTAPPTTKPARKAPRSSSNTARSRWRHRAADHRREWSRQHGGKWSEAVARIGHFVPAWAVKPHELPGWIENRMRSRGVRADRDAVQQLADLVEGNLLAAAQEIDKLALLADGGVLDAARMESLVADAARFDVFRLIDAALNGQGAQASRMLAGLRAEGDAVPALMGMIVMDCSASPRWRGCRTRRQPRCRIQGAARVGFEAASYKRALQRHGVARWERSSPKPGASTASQRAARPAMHGRCWSGCCWRLRSRKRCRCWRRVSLAHSSMAHFGRQSHTGHVASHDAVRVRDSMPMSRCCRGRSAAKNGTHANAAARRNAATGDRREPRLHIDRRELRRAGPSYTVDTLRELRDEFGPSQPIAWLVGADAIPELDTWREWRRLFEYAHVIAAERPSVRIDDAWLVSHAPRIHAELAPRRRDAASLRETPAGSYAVFTPSRLHDESSTEFRSSSRAARRLAGPLPPAVAEYIRREGLYRNGTVARLRYNSGHFTQVTSP